MSDLLGKMSDYTKSTNGDIPQAGSAATGFASAADFLEAYKTATFTMDNGLRVQFRELKAGDLALCRQTAINAMMTEAGIDLSDRTAVQKYAKKPDYERDLEYELRSCQQYIVHGVVTPRFSTRPAAECEPDIVPVEVLSISDTISLGRQISDFNKEGDADRFRESSETDETTSTSEEQPDQGGDTSGTVRTESV